jgi:hypothetical protein
MVVFGMDVSVAIAARKAMSSFGGRKSTRIVEETHESLENYEMMGGVCFVCGNVE